MSFHYNEIIRIFIIVQFNYTTCIPDLEQSPQENFAYFSLGKSYFILGIFLEKKVIK